MACLVAAPSQGPCAASSGVTRGGLVFSARTFGPRAATPDTLTDLLEKALNLTQKAFSVYMMQVRAAKDGAPVKAVSLKSTSFHLDAKATARLASRMNDLGLGVNGVTREDLLLAAFRIGGDALQDETTSAAEYRDADNAQVALRSGPLWAQALPTASSG